MITAIIFDMDGVIVDTQSVLDIHEFAFLKNLTGGKWSFVDQQSVRGRSLIDVYHILVKKFHFNTPLQIYLEQYDEVLKNIYEVAAQPLKGSIEIIKKLSFQKYQLALASSSSHKLIAIILKRFNLTDYFNVIVSADDVKGKSKPEPDIFLLTARKLEIKPEECVVIEDSENGIKAAKRAGMFCIGYKEPANSQKLELADGVITSFGNGDVSSLISRIEKSGHLVEKVKKAHNRYYFATSEQVNKSDYYSDFLMDALMKLFDKQKHISMLEIGTGRGYLPIILTKMFPTITKAVAVDIDPYAVALARQNVSLNDLDEKIEIRKGDMYDPIKTDERFDFIFGALPQMPITQKALLNMQSKNTYIARYHLNTSAGGHDGLAWIRRFVASASVHLKKDGFLVHVQAEFSHPGMTASYMQKAGLTVIGTKKRRKFLSETTLTQILKSRIEKQGFSFHQNQQGLEYFYLVIVIGKK